MAKVARSAFSERVAVKINADPASGRTKQSFAQECDINHIMRKYKTSGVLPVRAGSGVYGDYSNVGDFLEAQTRVIAAQRDFAKLPAAVRDRFRNNVAGLLSFVADPRNRDEAVKLGLIVEELEKVDGVVVKELEVKK